MLDSVCLRSHSKLDCWTSRCLPRAAMTASATASASPQVCPAHRQATAARQATLTITGSLPTRLSIVRSSLTKRQPVLREPSRMPTTVGRRAGRAIRPASKASRIRSTVTIKRQEAGMAITVTATPYTTPAITSALTPKTALVGLT